MLSGGVRTFLWPVETAQRSSATRAARLPPKSLRRNPGGAKRLSVDLAPKFRHFQIVDVSLLEDLMSKNHPFRIETAFGRVFKVPHRDFVSFSPKRTSIFISFEDGGRERYAIVPLLTVTAAETAA